MIVVGLTNSKELGRKIASNLNVEFEDLHMRDSSSGELHVKFNTNPKNQKVVIVQSLFPYPNHSLFEVLYVADAARDLGAKSVMLVAPYLAFSKEDYRTEKGECIQQNILGRMLSKHVDAVVSVESSVSKQNFKKTFSVPFYSLQCGEVLRKYVRENFPSYSIVGFDERSWEIASHISKDALLLNNGENLEISGDVLVVNDVISSGKKMKENLSRILKKDSKVNISLLAIHGIFNDNSFFELSKISNRILSCNTVNHETSRIDISGLIARKLMEL